MTVLSSAESYSILCPLVLVKLTMHSPCLPVSLNYSYTSGCHPRSAFILALYLLSEGVHEVPSPQQWHPSLPLQPHFTRISELTFSIVSGASNMACLRANWCLPPHLSSKPVPFTPSMCYSYQLGIKPYINKFLKLETSSPFLILPFTLLFSSNSMDYASKILTYSITSSLFSLLLP